MQCSCTEQAKEITRLNQVYNKLLKDAGCERVGERPPANTNGTIVHTTLYP